MSRGNVNSVRSPGYGVLIALLVAARERSGLSQTEICNRLGKHRNYIIKVENGEKRLDVIELFQLCRVMGTDPMELLSNLAKSKVI